MHCKPTHYDIQCTLAVLQRKLGASEVLATTQTYSLIFKFILILSVLFLFDSCLLLYVTNS